MALTLFTSIPAKVVRLDRAGRDIGAAYLQRCIASWLEAGYRMVSINGTGEARAVAELHPGIEVRQIDDSARAKTAGPLVPVSTLLREASASTDRFIGVMNADLLLHAPRDLQELLAGADGHTLIYGSRLDVDDVDVPGPTRPYTSGLDYFFFAPAVARDLPDEGFLLGETWWDYWLPVVMAKRGCRLQVARVPLVAHLRHDESTIASRLPTYLDYFHAFARSLGVRLPLPGDEPWSRQVRPLLAAFIRFYRRDATPGEHVYLSQFLSLALSLYLAQDARLFASFGAAWRPLADQAGDDRLRALAVSLLDAATEIAGAGSP
jgi:hypothetical protein